VSGERRGPEHPSGVGWWWLSFADGMRPKGQQFLGVVIIEGVDLRGAIQRTWAKGLNPGGEVMAIAIPPDRVPPADSRERLITSREDLAAIDAVMGGNEA
jgi:hypothetical protein